MGLWQPPTKTVDARQVLWQQSALRDGLITALTLDVFHRHADKLIMATLARTVNVLLASILTEGDRSVRTPSYHVFDMYLGHHGGTGVHAAFTGDEIDLGTVGESRPVQLLSGSASLKDDTLTLSVVNIHVEEVVDANVTIAEADAEAVTCACLSDPDLRAHNTFDQPDSVVPSVMALPVPAHGTWRHAFPSASVTVFTIRLKSR